MLTTFTALAIVAVTSAMLGALVANAWTHRHEPQGIERTDYEEAIAYWRDHAGDLRRQTVALQDAQSRAAERIDNLRAENEQLRRGYTERTQQVLAQTVRQYISIN